ncbi:MAG TPA: hypothetical protein VGI39_40605 [Polyangiaceae bacterium]
MSRVSSGVLAATVLLSAATIGPSLTPEAAPAPEGPDRPADQTFLTYPEWFLVFSPDERAAYLEARRPPSAFPYVGHVEELWEGYAAVREAIRTYPFNAGYHVMIVVIASSTTVEYGVEAAYETVVGRAFEVLPPAEPEDAFAARGARDYVQFIEVLPWYKFDFTSRLRELWAEPLPWGRTLPRALERRFWLTTEYAGKALYGWLIAKATAAGYTPAALTTRVVVDRVPEDAALTVPRLKRVGSGTEGVAADVPRYQAFTDTAIALAREGVRFRRIAGNDGAIALTVIAPSGWHVPAGASYRELFAQPVLTVPGRERVMVVTRVPELADTLGGLAGSPGVTVEHVFDY